MALLNVSQLSKGEGSALSLNNISFSQEALQKVAIAGETGSGKSSLLKIIAGLLQPDAGEVLFEQQRVKGPDEKLVAGHPHIAYLSQHFELPGFLRVEQVLQYANTLSETKAAEVYALCRISHLLKRKTDQLSGGEKQRIALARLLTTAPRLLLLDEPYSNLDMAHKGVLKAVIDDISEGLRITCTMVSHDPLDSLSWADEILVLKGGQLLQKGSPEHLYRRPLTAYVAGLFGKYTLIPPALAQDIGHLPGLAPAGKSMLLRPESVRLTEDKSSGLEGKIKRVGYYGSHYELEVILANTSMLVRTDRSSYQNGDRVWISLAPENIWYLS